MEILPALHIPGFANEKWKSISTSRKAAAILRDDWPGLFIMETCWGLRYCVRLLLRCCTLSFWVVTPHRVTHTVPQCTHDITKPYPQILNMQTIRTERRMPATENICAGVAATLNNDQFMGEEEEEENHWVILRWLTSSLSRDSRHQGPFQTEEAHAFTCRHRPRPLSKYVLSKWRFYSELYGDSTLNWSSELNGL